MPVQVGFPRIYPNRREDKLRLSSSTIPFTPPGGYALTKANFPGLIEAFTSDGISGNNLVGSLGTITVASSTGWVQPAAGQFRGASLAAYTTSGTWEAIGTRHALLIQIGSFNVSGIVTSFGLAASGPFLAVRGASQTDAILNTGVNSAVIAAVAGATYPVEGEATLLNQTAANGMASRFVVDGGVNLARADATVTGDISQSWPAFAVGAAAAAFATSGAMYYTGIFLVATASLPSDTFIFDAIQWMIANPKLLYPGFYQRT